MTCANVVRPSRSDGGVDFSNSLTHATLCRDLNALVFEACGARSWHCTLSIVMICCHQRVANEKLPKQIKWQIANGKRQTADSKQQTADGKHQTANSKLFCQLEGMAIQHRTSPHPVGVTHVLVALLYARSIHYIFYRESCRGGCCRIDGSNWAAWGEGLVMFKRKNPKWKTKGALLKMQLHNTAARQLKIDKPNDALEWLLLPVVVAPWKFLPRFI